MQRTEKYFEQDAFRTQCESTILAAEPDEKTGGGRIALDGTVFYPEGGGQPADRGTLTLPDGATLNVTDVHEHDGILWHSVDALPESAVPGTAVSGCIDWEWRFDKMQQHTGEHILSGKNSCISVFRCMVEHGSPAKALCCRKAPRVEQSPTPTMDREVLVWL